MLARLSPDAKIPLFSPHLFTYPLLLHGKIAYNDYQSIEKGTLVCVRGNIRRNAV